MNILKIPGTGSSRQKGAEPDILLTGYVRFKNYLLLAILLLIWPIAQYIITRTNQAFGFIDPNIWLLLLLSLICFMVVTGLCWWFLYRFWISLGLPDMGNMVLQFKELKGWHQLGFYWASFVSLLAAAVGVLMAIL